LRFLELNLKAFGTFSERAPIGLPDVDGPGLCVIYGSNEAGKSTALRAIRGLLYGIPTKTPDDFVHRYADLRIGARLRFDDGQELAVMRHKKNKDSLYSYDDEEVIRSERLDRLVEAVPESLFERFYGLDHPGLREGSAALLQDDGEVGRALFGAGLGVSNLHSVLAGLERDASALFAPRASKPRLNSSLVAWNEEQKKIGLGALDPKAWAVQEERTRVAEARVDAFAQGLAECRRELSSLERRKRSLPALARRREAQLRLDEERSVKPLPEDFSERLTAARAERRGAEQGGQRAGAKIERETTARDGLSLAPVLVAEQEAIEALHQRVGGIQEAVDQLPRRESKLASLDEEIVAIPTGSQEALTPERLARLRSAVAQTASTRALANEGVKLNERLAEAREEASEAGAALALLGERSGTDSGSGAASEGEVDTGPLRLALGRCLKLGPLDERIAEERNGYEEIDFEVERRGRALGLEVAASEEIDGASFPDHPLIDAMAEGFATLLRRRDVLTEEIQKMRSERRSVDESLAKNQSRGEVPKLADLDGQRADRDRTWRQLRRAVVDGDGGGETEAAPDLADRFEQESSGADALGDRLRVDADRVAEQGALEAKAVRLDLDLADRLDREKVLEEEGRLLDSRWAEAWTRPGVKIGSPEEMRGWRRAFDEWLALLGQRREAARAFERNEEARSEGIQNLRQVLRVLPGVEAFEGERLDEWLSQAEDLRERLLAEAEARRRKTETLRLAEERLAQAGQRLRRAESALADWNGSWQETASALDLARETRPERALERLEEMGRLIERLRERDELADRVGKMRADVEGFEQSVEKLVAACAPVLAEMPSGLAVQRLQRMLGEALEQQALYGKSVGALTEAKEELVYADAQSKASEAAIAALCGLAGVEAESSLDEALRSWRLVEETRLSLRQAESELTNLAEGRSIVALETETSGLDSDMLGAEIASLEERILRKTEDEKAAIEDWRSQRDALEAMDGSGRVAEWAELAESRLAVIRRDVDRYVELRMAKKILEGEIERYRSENQAPLLRRAGEIFNALTLGAYPRIESDIDEGAGQIRLVAVDPSNARIPVAGLSAGTRDQLFLAIRLASLEEAMSRGESMPLIADDILIEFDDRRSRACLEVLATMGQRNQILLFSHHRHIAEIAGELGDRAHLVEL
jgi:uncharacterized protein YhaN